MRKIPILLTILLMLTLIMATAVSAQATYPELNGSVADGADVLDQSNVQAAADRLARRIGAVPIALTYDSKGGVSADEFEKGFLEHNGYGNPDKQSLDSKVILVAIDYEDRGIKIWYGDAFTGALDPKVDNLIDRYITPNAGSDPSQAFIDVFQGIGDTVDLYRNPPTPAPQVAQPVIVPTVVVEQTTVNTEGIGSAFLKVMGWIIIIGLSILFLYLLFVKWLPAYRAKMRLITEVLEKRSRQTRDNVATQTKLPSDTVQNVSMSTIMLVLSDERPIEADEWEAAYEEQQREMHSIQQRTMQYARIEVGLRSDNEDLKKLSRLYDGLETERAEIDTWLKELEAKAAELLAIVDQVEKLYPTLEKKVADARLAYEQAAHDHTFLPKSDEALKVLNDMLASFEAQYVDRPITAMEVAKRIEEQISIFTQAFAAVMSAHETIERTQQELTTIIGVHTDACPIQEIMARPEAMLKQAVSELHDDDPYFDDALQSAQNVERICTEAVAALTEIVSGIGEYAKLEAELNEFFEPTQGFKNRVETEVRNATEDLRQVTEALNKADYVTAQRTMIDALEELDKAIQKMEGLEAMRGINTERLTTLSTETARVDATRKTTAQRQWKELQGFKEEDRRLVGKHFEEATFILGRLFDDPANPDDLASKATRLNSMGVQEFAAAEKIIADMEGQLALAERLLTELSAQHKKATYAKVNYEVILAKAKAAFEKAVQERDANNKKINLAVDQQLKKAQEASRQALDHLAIPAYTLAVDALEQVISLSDQAYASCKSQISRINELIKTKEQVKREAQDGLRGAKQLVDQTANYILTSKSHNTLRQAVDQMQNADNLAQEALTREDDAMARALESSVVAYRMVTELVEKTIRSVDTDQDSYEALYGRAKKAFESARRAITDANSVCEDYRSGTAGDHALARAVSRLGYAPSSGSTRDDYERLTHQYSGAETEAENAAEEAQDEIRAYERRKREREEREQRAREAAARAAREAREAQERAERARRSSDSSSSSSWSSSGSSSSSSSSRSSFGSGGSSSSRSFGGGGSSSRKGF
jgi:uncharacterized membrane protein YgcG